eukprot:3209479-Rhodomonas_salina.1
MTSMGWAPTNCRVSTMFANNTFHRPRIRINKDTSKNACVRPGDPGLIWRPQSPATKPLTQP